MRKPLICVLMAALCLLPLGAWAADYHVSVRGIQLRHLAHRPSEKWYMVAPVNLTGTQEQPIDLIAANSRVAGSLRVYVSAEGLTVTVSYPQGATVISQSLRLYDDLDKLSLDAPAGHLLTQGEALLIDETMRSAGVAWIYLEAKLSLPEGLAGLPYYTAQGPREIAQRIQLASQYGQGERYLERLGRGGALVTTGIPDEHGCIDGVCPVDLLPLPPTLLPGLPDLPKLP
jgi:hypothetical protein